MLEQTRAPRRITSTADVAAIMGSTQRNSQHERKSHRRSTKYLHGCMNLQTTRQHRILAQQAANPRPGALRKAQSKFVDPRSQAKLAETLAPVPTAKKRTYKAKLNVLFVDDDGEGVRASARIFGTMDSDGI